MSLLNNRPVVRSNAPILSIQSNAIKAIPIEINWHSQLPIFASESFLKSVGDEYGWLGGIDNTGEIRCILPYTIIQKLNFRLVRFRVETIPLGDNFAISDEKLFLNSVIDYFRSTGADIIIPATTNTIFRTFPDGADAAPYGSYIIDLRPPEEVLWRNIDRVMRQNINSAKKNGVTIRSGLEHLDAAYVLISDTFKRSGLPFMGKESFTHFVSGLGENTLIMTADHQGIAQSYVVFAFSDYCAYAIYAGNIANQNQGANKLLYWEAICHFKKIGINYYDFVGARIDPEKGSKQYELNSFKKRYGTTLKEGYMWKYSLHPFKYLLYSAAARLRSGGDIVDVERHKLQSCSGLAGDN